MVMEGWAGRWGVRRGSVGTYTSVNAVVSYGEVHTTYYLQRATCIQCCEWSGMVKYIMPPTYRDLHYNEWSGMVKYIMPPTYRDLHCNKWSRMVKYIVHYLRDLHCSECISRMVKYIILPTCRALHYNKWSRMVKYTVHYLRDLHCSECISRMVKYFVHYLRDYIAVSGLVW